MMPLTLASVGEENMIKKVGGSPKRGSSWRAWDLSQAVL